MNDEYISLDEILKVQSFTKRRYHKAGAIEEMPLPELRKIESFLPKVIQIDLPEVLHPCEPMSLIALEFYDLLLRLTQKILGRTRFYGYSRRNDKCLMALNHLLIGREFMMVLEDLLQVDGVRGIYLRSRVYRELVTKIDETRTRLAHLITSAHNRHGESFAIYSDEHTRLDRDIYFMACAGNGILNEWIPADEKADSFGETLQELAETLGDLYSRRSVVERLSATSKLFSRGILEIDIGKISQSSWLDNAIQIPLGQLTSGQNEPKGGVSPQLLDPTESLDDVIIPSHHREAIRRLCHLYQRQLKCRQHPKLTFLFRGAPGTGKSMTANAIASEMGKKILRVSFSEINPRTFSLILGYFAARAKENDCVLLIDEAEDALSGNRSRGLSDGWIKTAFDEFEGVAIFTTNYSVPLGVDRRMSYILDFKSPDFTARKVILKKEVSKYCSRHEISEYPDHEVLRTIAEDFPIPGGYLPQTLQLAAASSAPGTIETSAMIKAFEHTCALYGATSTDEVRESRVALEQVKLPTQEMDELQRFIKYARTATGDEKSRRRSAILPNGSTAIFSGPPGTGKTLAAEAVAHDLKLKFRRVAPSSFLSKWVGETEKHIRAVFREAAREGYVLFIDEAEGLLLDRQGANNSWEKTQVNELLQQIEGFSGVLIIATNHTEMLDPAFARRFLFHVKFRVPDVQTRRALWEQWKEPLGLNQAGLDFISTFDLSGGEIRNIAVRAIAAETKAIEELSNLAECVVHGRTGHSRGKIGLQ